MAQPRTRDKGEAQFDFTQRWTQFLRQTNKNSPTTPPSISCPRCGDRKVQQDYDALWKHVQEVHGNILPPKWDTSGTEKLKEEIKLQSHTAVIRPSRDDASTKPHEDLVAVETETLPAPPATASGTFQPVATTTALTTNQLKDFQKAQIEEDPALKGAEAWENPIKTNRKRRARDDDQDSPSSSVVTMSTDSKRRMPQSASPQQKFSSQPSDNQFDKQELDRDGTVRPPTMGKLFEPDSNQNALNTNSTRPRNSSHQQPRKNTAPQQRTTSYKPAPSPGFIPMSILNAQTLTAPNNITSSKADESGIVRQPETRPISQEQLVAEVKGIYAGLVMVEGKCIQVDAKQAALAREAPPGTQPKLNNEQWQALIALHRTLLHEHHDFFLASQHPSATPAVRKLAIKYAMPARLWRHGIHSFLELLRNRLPDSLDHMLAFIYLAYSMMTLLYETVPAFEETWIECLGDLGRYRMAIEDDDIRDREVWTQVARQWYLKASDRAPKTGRLYHHLAILARPNALQQLFFYGKALSVSQPFLAAKESILTLFDPILSGKAQRRLPVVITAYIKANAILFTQSSSEDFGETLTEFIYSLDSHISRVTQRYLEQGYYIAISNCLALLSFGSVQGPLVKALADAHDARLEETEIDSTTSSIAISESQMFVGARKLFCQTIELNCQRVGDPNVLSFLHVTLIFMVHLSSSPAAMRLIGSDFPWQPLVAILNSLARFYRTYSRIETDTLPIQAKNDFRPTPEEFAMKGLDWAAFYFPNNWFANKNIEDENQFKEDASMNTEYRPERNLWLGWQLAKSGKYIRYNEAEHNFFLPKLAQTGDNIMTPATSSGISEADSTTDSATLMADDDGGMDEMSSVSRSSRGISEQAQEEESGWKGQKVTSFHPQGIGPGDQMEIEEESILTVD